MSAFDFEDEEQEIAKFKNRKKQKIELSKKIVINSTSDTPTRSNVTSIPISDEKTDKENENTEHKVVYVYSKEYSDVCSTLPTNIDRSHMVHSLVESYGLFDKMRIVKPILASIEELTEFHNTNYIKFLQMADSNTYDKRLTEEKVEDTTERHGLVDDCPIFENVFQYAQYVAGGTLTAAKQLTRKACSIAINWDGGRHHAKKDKASGFCYVNDIVLGILQLMNDFERILYIDIDIHHGDGVEQAFYYTDRVFTLSFHHYSPGFFPGTGGIERTGEGIGELHSANVPLQEGLDDETFVNLFTEIVSEVDRVYNPLVIVMCCGADCLVNDRLGNWNLTHQGVGQCVSMVRKLNKKILMLGGGGYNNSNAARNWTNLTGLLVDEVLEDEIPEHDYFDQYGPDFKLKIRKGNRENMNTKERIEKLKNEILENVKELSLIKAE